jgi:tetratricopeptide (TPR) repeat protein
MQPKIGVVVFLGVTFLACSLQNKDAYMAQGLAFAGKHDYEAAILSFKNAVRLAPSDPEAHFQLGLAYLAHGEPAEAVANVRRAVILNPRHWPAQIRLAEFIARSLTPDLTDARRRVAEVLAVLPEHPEALRVLALIEIRNGQRDKAVSHLGRALALKPAFLEAATMLASIHLAERDIAAAERVLENLIEADPRSNDGVLALARLYLSTGRLKPAMKAFQRVLSKNPRAGPAALGLAAVYAQERKFDAAESVLRGIAGQSDDYQSLYESFLFATGKTEAAINLMQSRHEARPGDKALRDRLVRAYVATDRPRRAEDILGAALKQDHSDGQARLLRAELYLSTHRYSEAEADVIQVAGRSAEAHWVASAIHRVRGAFGPERNELEQALRTDPTFLRARVQLSKNISRSGDLASAILTLDQAPSFQKSHPLVVFERIWLRLESRDLAAAEKAIDEAAKHRYPGLELQLQKAVLALMRQNPAAARESAAKILRRRPEDARALEVLLGTYKSAAERRSAVHDWLGNTSVHRSSGPFEQLAGALLWQVGEVDASRTAFSRGLAIEPRLWTAELALASAQAQNDAKSSREHLERVLAITGGQASAYVMLGQLEEIDHNFTAAADNYRKALDLAPNDVRALNNLAYAILEHGGSSLDEALRLARRAHTLAPDDPSVNDTLGWAFFKMAQYGTAVEFLRKSQRNPTPVPLYHLARVSEMLGDRDRAEKLFAAARKLDPSLAYVPDTDSRARN